LFLPFGGPTSKRSLAPILAFLVTTQLVACGSSDAPDVSLATVGPERAPSGLLVRMPSIGGVENAACFSYPPWLRVRPEALFRKPYCRPDRPCLATSRLDRVRAQGIRCSEIGG
jgi:hypothetical protein